ncbi:MAG: dicarboxylate/amino acid:cation symporter [Henriciella sp.]|nr:dicarboxylate/amino acid:cation symporter [Henriciella sp.]
MSWWFKAELWKRVMIGLVAGLVVGLSIRLGMGLESASEFTTNWIKPWGDAFVRLIRMLIVPLIAATLIAGIVSMGDASTLRKVGVRAFGLYGLTTLGAIILGLSAALIFNPGIGVEFPELTESVAQDVETRLDAAASASASLTDRLLAIIPSNPIAAMVSGDILGVIFFSIMFGIGILFAGEQGKAIGKAIDSASSSLISLTDKIMDLAPFGVFALMVWVASTQDYELMLSFVKLTLVLYGVCLIQILIVYPTILIVFGRESPARFFRGMSSAMAIAYSTASSAATLPATIESLVKNLGVKRSNATGVAAIGSTINMDGAAIYLSLVCIFALQASGQPVTMNTVMTIAVLATLGSVGAAGIPNGGLFMSAALLTALGFSAEQVIFFVAILFPFDRVLDMMRTLTNVTGDATVATCVDRSLTRQDSVHTQTNEGTA